MINEEKKSNEITAEYLMGHDRLEVTYEEIREAVMAMAKWKDARFKRYLERKKNKLNEGVKNFLEKEKADTALLYQTQIVLLNEIINELFGGE